MTRRFTVDGNEALERRLAASCQRVLDGVRGVVPASRLEGVLLGGGYGRGEGGVLGSSDGDEPYNDLEFYVFVRGNALFAERRYHDALHELGERLSDQAGVEVEFKVLTLGRLRRSAPSMFYYDLAEGHRWIMGDDRLLRGCEHHRNAKAIPLHEATRLLFNRCSGLLFTLERLSRAGFGAKEADFANRNLAKARLAFGDVLLTADGEYHWSCRERHRRLMSRGAFEPALAWAEPLKALHAAGVEFKLHPQRASVPREQLAAEHAELSNLGAKLWLWLESKRLGHEFTSPREYALSSVDKCPETLAWRNRLVNARAFGPQGLADRRYPRERLFQALALLLWEPQALGNPALLGLIQTALRTKSRDLVGLVSAYFDLWRRFN
ncbi:MAG: hypothetical protein AB9869_10605 [Verrucomicrobiia bacterium]